MTTRAGPRPHGTAVAEPVPALWCGDGVLEAARPGFVGRVQGTFDDGFYVSGPAEEVFAVMGPRHWPGPLHLVAGEMAELPAVHNRAHVTDGTLVAGPVRVPLDGCRRWAPSLPERLHADPEAWHGLAAGVDIELAPVWEAVRHDLRRGDLAAVFGRLAGRGPGLTPSGDDVLAGLLLVCAMDPARRGALGRLACSARTTTLSRAYLRWAAVGQSIQPAHALLEAVAAGDPSAMVEATRPLAAVGATSGRALIAGMALAATELAPNAVTRTMVSRPPSGDAGQEIIPMPISESPRFLETAARTSKPRRRGITHVIDKGTPLAAMNDLLEAHGPLVDVWKFGFGTAYVDGTVGAKVELLRGHEVRACPGGTLLEAAWWQGRSAEFLAWAERVGFDCVEVSRGATGLPASSKSGLIGAARDHGFEVFAEVGSKDPHEPALASEWLAEARSDLDCGAAWLVAEGRESGTVGLYAADGSVRAELVEALGRLGEDAPVVYEAPLRQQQAWLVNHLGANVNLANIAPEEVLGVEALRQGLRSDTLRTSLPTHTAGSLRGP